MAQLMSYFIIVVIYFIIEAFMVSVRLKIMYIFVATCRYKV